MPEITTFITYNDQAEAAVKHYLSIFDGGKIVSTMPGPSGTVMSLTFELLGKTFIALNGGPNVTFNMAVSFQVFTDTQEETDRLWNAIVQNGGKESACSWCVDKYGLHWQIAPRALMAGITDPDPAVAKRVMLAMMDMTKIDIAAIEAARRG